MPRVVRGESLPPQWASLSAKTKAEILCGKGRVRGAEAWAAADKTLEELNKRFRPTAAGFELNTGVVNLHDDKYNIMLSIYRYENTIDGKNINVLIHSVEEPFGVFPSPTLLTQLMLLLR